MSHPLDKDLIEKFLRGECSAAEAEVVRLFLQKAASEELLHQILSSNEEQDWQTFHTAHTPHPHHQHWLDIAHERITAAESPVTSMKPRRRLRLQYAAIWLGLMGIALSIYLARIYKFTPADKLVFIERSNPDGQRTKITLSDSSVVYLGAGSRLRYPEKFAAEKREIALYGEAFFEVTKNPQRPFIIKTGEVSTKVLGTSFKIEAFKDKALQVEVATGKVRVDRIRLGKIQSLAILLPGQRVVYFHDTAKTEKVELNEVTGLRDARLTFRDASLLEIAGVLGRWYNVKINFKKQEMAGERMTLTLDANVSIDKIFNVLSAAGNFKYQIINNQIIIR